MKQSTEPSPIWISGILLLLALSIIGIMLYVKIVIDKTQPEISDSATTEITASPSPKAADQSMVSVDTKSADQTLSSADANIASYNSAATEIDASIDDAQGDLSE